MSQEFRRISSADLNDHLRVVVEERLHDIIITRQPGHCMRVGDLDSALMMSVGRNLATAMGASAQVHVLSRDVQSEDPLTITSSKLVELRNVPADGVQRPPLLVFVPNDLRTAAEDSFAEATFEQISIADCFSLLRKRLINQLPTEFRSAVEEILRVVEERNWRWADDVGSVRFLLSILLNGLDAEIVGASLCEIGLAPDFHLLDDVSALPYRLAKNLECVQKLTFSTKSERGRVLDLNLKDHAHRATLSDYLDQCGLEDPLIWCRRIVSEKQLWPLSFDKWSFEDSAGFTQQVQVEVLQLGLPVIQADETDSRLRQLIGQQVLLVGKGGPKAFKVKFRSNPAPETLQGLDHFRLQVVAREAGPTAFTKKKKAWVGARQDASVSFTNVTKVDWEDGWHFVKVLPCTVDGDPIPLVDAQGKPVPLVGGQDEGQFPNESDLFYVVKADDVEIDVPQRAIPKFPSFDHALINFRFTALANGRDTEQVSCTHRAWVESEDNKGKGELLEFKFSGEGLVHVPVSRILKILEQRILSSPDDMFSWRLTVSTSQTAELASESSPWPLLPEMEEFRSARRELFAKIRGEDKDQILESTDLSDLRSEIARFAERYLAVLAQALRSSEAAASDQQPQSIAQLQKLLTIDTALINISDHHGGHRAALLVGPTHPLRLLWLATWLTLADNWLDKARKAPKEYISPTRDALLERLSCVNFPAVLPMISGQLFSAVDNVHPFWSVYSSEAEGDSRGLMTEICMALGLPEPNIGSFSLNGRFLADRVRRYLVQHPYIQTLVLNCFNAGQGKLLVEMLLELQKERDFHDLRYDIRLFVADPDAPGAGADLSDLISPGSTLTVAEADAFATPTGTHLAPKLAFSVRDILDFRNMSSEFPAHLSLLFDVFPAQNISAQAPRAEDEGAPVHGLLQEFTVDYVEDAELVAWNRRPRHGLAIPLPGFSEFSTLLARLAQMISAAAASVATGQIGLSLRPVLTLVLAADQKALLHQVHDVSDWVFTIDKSLGIEFFDHQPGNRRPEYLIDHSPDLSSNSGRRVVITSRSQTEIRVLFERVLEDYGFAAFQDRAHGLLSELRALSGRIALKLVSSPTHRAEALGLALAKMYLEFQDVFRGQAVVPLDAHLDLFRALQRNPDQLEDEISLRRTDLALFDFDAGSRVITCSLVEVKCYRAATSLSGLSQLKGSIAEQINQSARTLRYHFDPDQTDSADRPDRIIKTQEFVNLLEFYIDRANRLHLMSFEAYQEAKFFLRTMESGYKLRFTRSALVFDLDKEGLDELVEDDGIEYHRIGVDLIRQLLEALPAKLPADETGPAPRIVEKGERSQGNRSTMEFLAERVSKLERAAFLPEQRDRTVDWDRLRSSSSEPDLEDGQGIDFAPKVRLNPSTVAIPSRGTMPVTRLEPINRPIEAVETRQEPLEVEPPSVATASSHSTPTCDVLLGVNGSSPQFGIIGKVMGRTVGLDLNQTHTISLFGVQGGGKSYTLGSIIEMATLALPGINQLPQPLAAVVFHYSQTQDYKPEFTSMNRPNNDAQAIETLASEYHASPRALEDVVLLVPAGKLEARRAEYPGLSVRPLKFSSSELQAGHWRFLMGAVGNQATYIRKLNQIMRSMRDDLTLMGLRTAIEQAGFPDNLHELANLRLDLAADYIDDTECLRDVVRPGRLVIVDLRDEFIEKDEALGLFVVLLQIFGDATFEGNPFNKLVVFDEAHKYIGNPDLVEGMIGVVREMRHKGTSILVASQDPPSVPVSLIELSTQIILHRFNSPAWLKHIQKANASLVDLSADQLAKLKTGEAFIWSSKATDQAFSRGAVKTTLRPRATFHGGATRTAV